MNCVEATPTHSERFRSRVSSRGEFPLTTATVSKSESMTAGAGGSMLLFWARRGSLRRYQREHTSPTCRRLGIPPFLSASALVVSELRTFTIRARDEPGVSLYRKLESDPHAGRGLHNCRKGGFLILEQSLCNNPFIHEPVHPQAAELFSDP